MNERGEGKTPAWLASLEGGGEDTGTAEERDGASGSSEEPDAPLAEQQAASPPKDRRVGASGGPWPASENGSGSRIRETEDALASGLAHLREEAIRAAREDADAGLPDSEVEGTWESERSLTERCRAFFERWHVAEERRLHRLVAAKEEKISELLNRASLGLDRFERLTNELVRLKARLTTRRREVGAALGEDEKQRRRGLSTGIYAAAIGFLGVVEFFANAPVFGSLLPRDPLTERQIQLIGETSEGWLAGAERVVAHLILRPDAALLAAGVVTFLCVLAHFFGHSLREFVIQKDANGRQDTVSTRSPMENVVPMVISGLGLILVLGVLYEARVTLGEVGEQQFAQDSTAVQELRRNAGWMRADGDLLAANQLTNRADDMESAAVRLREYAASMSRLSFPILLLNMTLVLCAISAAYFHRRDARGEFFNEDPFEQERREYIEAAESAASTVSETLSDLVRHIRELKSLLISSPLRDRRGVVHQLESVVALYRAENGRLRGMDARRIPAFREPVRLDISLEEGASGVQDPAEYQRERQQLKSRFDDVRRRFNEETLAW